MIYKQSSIDMIGSLIDSLTFAVKIISVVNNGGGVHTLTVCDAYHAQPGFEVTIGGKTYEITEVTPGTNEACSARVYDVMKVRGTAANITATTFDMYRPHFFYGTPMAEGTELAQENIAKNKTPMYWLRLDDFSDHVYPNDGLERRERDIKARIYPLTQADHEKWLTTQATNEAVKPMYRLAEILVRAIESRPERFDTDTFEYDIPAVYPKFGVISINRGVEKSLWHDKLGGVELAMNLTVYKQAFCDGDCES